MNSSNHLKKSIGFYWTVYSKNIHNVITETGTYFEYKKALDYIVPDINRPFLYTLAQDSVKEFKWAKKILNSLKYHFHSNDVSDDVFKTLIQKEILSNSEDSFITKKEAEFYL